MAVAQAGNGLREQESAAAVNQPDFDGFPIGGRRALAVALAARNAARVRLAWLEQIPHEPVELVSALGDAGVDLDELWRVLGQKRGSRR